MNTQEVLDKIFKDPKTKYELTEFENLGRPIHEILTVEAKTVTSGRETGKTKYFAKSFVPFPSGKEEAQVYVEDGKASPEEIIRQLWVYKLIHQYDYKEDQIELEKSIQFGTEVSTKAADIVVYIDNTKTTPKIIVETKKPKRKDGIEQLKSYLNAEGSPVGVWSNGADRIILYRPYPKKFDDTLFDIPRRDQLPKDVLEARRTLGHLRTAFNFKSIVYNMEELALANYGDGVFDEIFKIIFAKIFDEIDAEERTDKEVLFNKSEDAEITYSNINKLFQKACEKWPGVFKNNDKIELKPTQLSVCIGEMVGVRLMGSNLRILDDAFEYLIPSALKKKDGQFFTPRHVIDMCVRMLNPKKKEYILDPACGSAGFLLHAMEWCYPADTSDKRELRKHKYASKYLWGIDISEKSARTSRALMLIAGDGHTNIFGPRISSLDPTEWLEVRTGRLLMESLRTEKLLQKMPEPEVNVNTSGEVWEYYENLNFDIVLTNPPFSGELTDRKMLAKYDLAKPALKRAKNKQAKEERDRIFIERIIKCLKPGGCAAIVLPQSIFNNSSLAFIREWIIRKARLLAIVSLHGNTFKPHAGTKTSVVFLKKYSKKQLGAIENIKQEVAGSCPDYETQIEKLIEQYKDQINIPEDQIPENMAELLLETFGGEETETVEKDNTKGTGESEVEEIPELEELIEKAEEKILNLRNDLIKAKGNLEDLTNQQEALKEKQLQEIQVIADNWSETKKALNAHLKPIKAEHKKALKELKESKKEKAKKFKAEIKALGKAILEAEIELKLLTNRGKLQLLLEDPDLIATLKERYIDAEVAKKLDYPIFMAVSEHGGKNNSGDYEYVLDDEGNLIEDDSCRPIIDQDLVNYELAYDDLIDAASIPDDKLCIAEAFVRFAQKNKFDFWCGRTAKISEIPGYKSSSNIFYQMPIGAIVLGRRNDPEFFHPKYVKVIDKILTKNNVRLKDIASVSSGFPWKSAYFLEGNEGEPVVRIRNCKPGHIDISDLTSINPAYANSMGVQRANSNDIVIGMDGVKYFYASLIIEPCYINQRVAIVRLKEGSKVTPEYLLYVINSYIGQSQLLRAMTVAATVGHISNNTIRNLLIPFIDDEFVKRISSIIKKSIRAQLNHKMFLMQATEEIEGILQL